jgi:hypothetical protein
MAYSSPEANHGPGSRCAVHEKCDSIRTCYVGTIVSLVAFVAVIQRWHAFNAGTKFEAAVFLFVLATYPIYELVDKKRKQDGLGRFYALIFGYTLILLAIIVFSAG